MSLFIIPFYISLLSLQPYFYTSVAGEKMKYLALGDSYTIGESVEPMERFPIQLVNKLKLDGLYFAKPEIIAKTGWTTDELIAGIDSLKPANNFNLVTLLIGVNNQYRGRDINNYREEFEILLKKSIEFSGGNKDKVIVISIPDYGVTPFGQKKGRKKIGIEIDQFNTANLEICSRYRVAYIDITSISRRAYRRNNLIAEDGLHPSGEMYAKWVDEILPVASKLLHNQR